MSYLNPVADSYYPSQYEANASNQVYQYTQPYQLNPATTLQTGYVNDVSSQSIAYSYDPSLQTNSQSYVQQTYVSPLPPHNSNTSYAQQQFMPCHAQNTNSVPRQSDIAPNSNFYHQSQCIQTQVAQTEQYSNCQVTSPPVTADGPFSANIYSHTNKPYQQKMDIDISQGYRNTQSLNGIISPLNQNSYQPPQQNQRSHSQNYKPHHENQYPHSQQHQYFQPQGNRYSHVHPAQEKQFESMQSQYTGSQPPQPMQTQYKKARQEYHQSQQDQYPYSRREQSSQPQQNQYDQSFPMRRDNQPTSHRDRGYKGESFNHKNTHSSSTSTRPFRNQSYNAKPENNPRDENASKTSSNLRGNIGSLHSDGGESSAVTDGGESSAVTPVGHKKEFKSPLNDFGDMGAAVQRYVALVPKKMKSNSEDFSGTDGGRLDENDYRRRHGLSVWDNNEGGSIPDPFEHFEDFPGLKEAQLGAFYNAGFKAPTPIQAQTWPIALKERDLVSIAKTGSGKTLAFLLPAYHKIGLKFGGRHSAIHMLVLAPTRELAVQIQTEADKFGSIVGYRTACAYGGAPKGDQLRAINSGATVLIATPGRLNDFLDSRQVNISSVFYLVLDEADRMLDMGFEPQIRSILRRLNRQRQTLMFSATWPEEVRMLANDFLNNPVHIRLGNQETLQANENIRQYLMLLNSSEHKDEELVQLLHRKCLKRGDLILVFVARKNTCEFVTNMLNRVGIHAAAMHGDRTQEYREQTLAAFKDGSLPVLVATDVASRGLDVKGLIAVVNYDLPGSTEDYVHRIGRTGRAGLTGESYTFLSHSHEDTWKALGIVEVMEKTGQEVPRDVQLAINQLKEKQKQNLERRAAEDEQFSKVLIVAEKPSVAKMIAEHLSSNGRFRTRRGKSRANQIFELIKWFSPAQKKCKIMVTSVVGHIFGLNFEDGRCKDLATLFDAPVKKVIEDNTKKLCIVEHLQELAAEAEFLFLWLDCDREGENIGFEVISLTQSAIHYDNVYRARFSSLTKPELQYAYDNPERPDKYSAMSVDARQELDLKIGVAFTRLMTRTYLEQARAKFRLKDQKCVSYGPCQTPTLWFCVQRHKEIQAFERKKYYLISLDVDVKGRKCKFQYIDENINDLEKLKQIEAAVNSSKHAVVVDVIEENKRSAKPIGLNTVTLLKACSKGLGISPSSAMNAAEHLYTCGFISYPRTETTAYSPNFDLVGALEEQANHPNWGKVATHLLRSGQICRPEKGRDVGDHPPITPVKAASRDEITKPNEWRIYDYVTRHFIATLHNDMEYMEYKIIVDIGGHQFFFTSNKVLDRGYTFAMPWKEKSLNLNEMQLPPLEHLRAKSLPISGFKKEENYTKPPDYLQESELISLMDKHGIGTDASIPQHIKNIQERHYVDVCGPGEDGKKGAIIPKMKFFGKNNRGRAQPHVRPTSRHMVPRGFGLAFLSSFELLDYELCEPRIRGYMEQQINKIATGETEKGEVVVTNLKLFRNKFLAFRDNLQRVDRYFAPKLEFQDGGYENQRGGFAGRGGFRGGHNGGERGGFNTQSGFRGGRNGGENSRFDSFDGRRGGFRGGNNGGERGGFYNHDGRGGFKVGDAAVGMEGDVGNDNNNYGGRKNNFSDARGGRNGNRGARNNLNTGNRSQENTFFPNDKGKRGNQSYGRGNFKRQKTWE